MNRFNKTLIRRPTLWVGLGAVACGVGVSACGLEAFFHEVGGTDHQPVVSMVSGTIANNATEVTLVQADDSTLAPSEVEVGGGRYTLTFSIDGSVTNGLIEASEGANQLWAWLLELGVNQSVEDVNLNANSTAKVLIMRGAMSAQDRNRQTLDVPVARVALSDIDERIAAENPPETQLVDYVDEILMIADPADTESKPWVTPVLTSSTVVTSALDPTWWSANGSNASFSQEQFDQALLDSASAVNVVGCIDPDNIRVVFEVTNADGRPNSACDKFLAPFEAQDRSWVTPDPGDSMRFVGGVVEDSPIQDSEISLMLGDMVPTASLPMFDDGTNGDQEAGDGIYTISFILPKGMYIQYKYLWGKGGDGWNGHEEWPGNAHWLEIADVNGDNFVRRFESFGDEAGNKGPSKNACCGARFLAQGLLTWDEPGNDPDEDGFANTRERPFDVSEPVDCVWDEWVTPTAIGPATVECPVQ